MSHLMKMGLLTGLGVQPQFDIRHLLAITSALINTRAAAAAAAAAAAPGERGCAPKPPARVIQDRWFGGSFRHNSTDSVGKKTTDCQY
jgi:hypothetical protein